MHSSKKSFFERLTGTVKLDDEAMEDAEETRGNTMLEDTEEEGQLTVDVHQTPDEIVI
jgi:hypothetical protein